MTQRILHGSAARIAVAPSGFSTRAVKPQNIGVGYAPGSADSDAAPRVLAAFDPTDSLLVREHCHSEGELDPSRIARPQGQAADQAAAGVTLIPMAVYQQRHAGRALYRCSRAG